MGKIDCNFKRCHVHGQADRGSAVQIQNVDSNFGASSIAISESPKFQKAKNRAQVKMYWDPKRAKSARMVLAGTALKTDIVVTMFRSVYKMFSDTAKATLKKGSSKQSTMAKLKKHLKKLAVLSGLAGIAGIFSRFGKKGGGDNGGVKPSENSDNNNQETETKKAGEKAIYSLADELTVKGEISNEKSGDVPDVSEEESIILDDKDLLMVEDEQVLDTPEEEPLIRLRPAPKAEVSSEDVEPLIKIRSPREVLDKRLNIPDVRSSLVYGIEADVRNQMKVIVSTLAPERDINTLNASEVYNLLQEYNVLDFDQAPDAAATWAIMQSQGKVAGVDSASELSEYFLNIAGNTAGFDLEEDANKPLVSLIDYQLSNLGFSDQKGDRIKIFGEEFVARSLMVHVASFLEGKEMQDQSNKLVSILQDLTEKSDYGRSASSLDAFISTFNHSEKTTAEERGAIKASLGLAASHMYYLHSQSTEDEWESCANLDDAKRMFDSGVTAAGEMLGQTFTLYANTYLNNVLTPSLLTAASSTPFSI